MEKSIYLIWRNQTKHKAFNEQIEFQYKLSLIISVERTEVQSVLNDPTVSGLVGNIYPPFVFKPNNFR